MSSFSEGSCMRRVTKSISLAGIGKRQDDRPQFVLKLDPKYIDMSDEYGYSISALIETADMKMIKSLILSNGWLEDNNMIPLLKLISNSDGRFPLTVLDLSMNSNLSIDVGLSFRNTLKRCPFLWYVNLDGTSIPECIKNQIRINAINKYFSTHTLQIELSWLREIFTQGVIPINWDNAEQAIRSYVFVEVPNVVEELFKKCWINAFRRKKKQWQCSIGRIIVSDISLSLHKFISSCSRVPISSIFSDCSQDRELLSSLCQLSASAENPITISSLSNFNLLIGSRHFHRQHSFNLLEMISLVMPVVEY